MGFQQFSFTYMFPMLVGDTVIEEVQVSGSTKTVGVAGGQSGGTYFSGRLVE